MPAVIPAMAPPFIGWLGCSCVAVEVVSPSLVLTMDVALAIAPVEDAVVAMGPLLWVVAVEACFDDKDGVLPPVSECHEVRIGEMAPYPCCRSAQLVRGGQHAFCVPGLRSVQGTELAPSQARSEGWSV